jgi:hypothetical protein
MTNESLTFSNPNEELAYLRSKVLEAEKKLERFGGASRETTVRETISQFKSDYIEANSNMQETATRHAAELEEKHRQVGLEEMMGITETKGILYSLSVAEKIRDWKLEDDFHDYLVSLVNQGLPIRGMKETTPLYKAIHMTLYEVVLPKVFGTNEKPLGELIKSMEQLYAGMMSLAETAKTSANYMALEVANPEGAEETRAFVSVPTEHKHIFEKQTLSIFPNAQLIAREHDYNIFNEFGASLGASGKFGSFGAYPLKTYESFGEDPLNVLLSIFTQMPKDGAGAAIQIIFKPSGERYVERYKNAIKELEKGKKTKEVLKDESFSGELRSALGFLIAGEKKKDDSEKVIDTQAIETIKEKLVSPIVEANLRIAVSGKNEAEAKHYLAAFESAFNQFANPGKNSLTWENVVASKESDFYRAFTFRLFRENEILPLNLRELSSLVHFHTEALKSNTSLKQSLSKSAEVPQDMKTSGRRLGLNRFQGQEREVYIGPDDRLRHFYTIGQTGTGKSTLLKNMVIDDIKAGEGVCYMDPHGSDIYEILANVPPERMGDVIYFDPADVERPMGLNMLEYNKSRPEEKTFVVNELFSIFQKLYGGVPESMGPMFEQYFRNSALLAIDDPDSGSTLIDISRVLSNKEYRDYKLSKTSNPVLIQFWTEIANKAGGDASLANIVPYITSKFDVFLANDIMRPIVASEKSAFNMRNIMDSKKILLVNLAKGRLGDINSNLLGLILVGKILLAALSRVDAVGQNQTLPPFYLYIDEFQNVTTNSIATILSEARKYKLSLNIAHQFIAQLDENIKNAVFGNVGSMCAFRVGADDAKYLESQFAPTFKADDLMNVDNRHALLKLLVNGKPATPFDIETIASPKGEDAVAKQVIENSRMTYGRDRAEVEAEVREKYVKKADAVAPTLLD